MSVLTDGENELQPMRLWRSPASSVSSKLASSRGEHSFWARLVLVEGAHRPVAADEVVVVVLDNKLAVRVTKTGFALSIFCEDIVRVVSDVRRGKVEVHVPAAPVGEPSALRLRTRMYMFDLFDRSVSDQLHRILLRRVDGAARARSNLIPAWDEVSVGSRWRATAEQPSFFPTDALRATGFYELALGVGDGAALQTEAAGTDGHVTSERGSLSHSRSRTERSSSAARNKALQLGDSSPDARRPSAYPTATAHAPLSDETFVRPVKVHRAVAPSEWRLDLLRPAQVVPPRQQLMPSRTRATEVDNRLEECPSRQCEGCNERIRRLEGLVEGMLRESDELFLC